MPASAEFLAGLTKIKGLTKNTTRVLEQAGGELELLATKATKPGERLSAAEETQFRKIYSDYLTSSMNDRRAANNLGASDMMKAQEEIRNDFFNKVLGHIGKTDEERVALRAALTRKSVEPKGNIIVLADGTKVDRAEYDALKAMKKSGIDLGPNEAKWKMVQEAEKATDETAKAKATRSHSADHAKAEAQKAVPPAKGAFSQEDKTIQDMASDLLASKQKNTKSPDDFSRLQEALIEKKLFHYGSAEELGRKKFSKLTDVVKEFQAGRAITAEEFAALKVGGAKPAASLAPQAQVHGQTINQTTAVGNLIKTAVGAPGRLGHWILATEERAWNGWEPAIRRLGATTALVGTLGGMAHVFWNTDLEGLGVTSKNYLGIIREPLDNITESKLEAYSGNKGTHWISDQDFDRLTTESGIRNNKAFETRTEKILGKAALDPIKAAQEGTPDFWRAAINLATNLKSVEGSYSNREIMYSYKYALANNLGMPSNKEEVTAATIVDFATNQYVETAAQLFVNPNRGEKTDKLRLGMFESYLGSKVPENQSKLNDALLERYAEDFGNNGRDPLVRRIVESYLSKVTNISKEDMNPGKVRELLKTRAAQGQEQIQREAAKSDTEGMSVLARTLAENSEDLSAPARSKTVNVRASSERVGPRFLELTETNDFELKGKESALKKAWDASVSPEGFDAKKFDKKLSEQGVSEENRKIVGAHAQRALVFE